MSRAGIRTDVAADAGEGTADQWEFNRDRQALEAAPTRVGEVGRLIADGLSLREISARLRLTSDEVMQARAEGRRYLRLRRRAMEARAAGEVPERSAVLLR